MYKVMYSGGPGRDINSDVDFMLVTVDGVELYAEMVNPTWDSDRQVLLDDCATEAELKAEIIRQAEERGIDVTLLDF